MSAPTLTATSSKTSLAGSSTSARQRIKEHEATRTETDANPVEIQQWPRNSNEKTVEPFEDVAVPDDTPPDGGLRAWVVVGCMSAINGFTWGVVASFGVYLSYYINNDIFPGATSMDYTFVGGSTFAASMMVAPLVNISARRFGTNIPMYCGCVLFALGFVLASFAQEFWQLVLTQGVIVGFGIGFIWIPSIAILPQWFSKRRSLANGISSAGSGAGGIIYSFATTPMIKNISYPWSLRITGLTSFIVLITASMIIRDRNKAVRPRIHPFDTKLLRKYQVLLVLGWDFTNLLGYTVVLYSLSAYAIAIGLTQSQGSLVIGILNLGTLVGRPFIGIASDSYGRITVAALLTLFNGIVCFAIWIPATNYAVLIAFALVVGATVGVFWNTIGPLCAEVVDLKDLPSMLALSWLTSVLPCFFSEAIALELAQTGTGRPYINVQIYSGVVYCVASLFLFELRRVRVGLLKRERHG